MLANPRLLNNIQDTKQTLTLHFNAVKAILTQNGDLKGYSTTWYHPDNITNILSLNNVQKKHKVTYDSSQKTGFIGYKADGTNCVFMRLKKGIFFTDVLGDVGHVPINKNKTQLKSTLMPIRPPMY